MGKVARIILIVALALIPIGALAQGLASSAASLNIVDNAASLKSSQDSKEKGISTSELLPGNGSRAGYVLGHGNIIPGSEWVCIGVKRGKANVDYTIDYASGNIFFSEPVRQMDSIRIDYSYSEKSKGERSVTGPGMLALSFGNSLQTNFVYSYRTANSDSAASIPDILTYGLNTTTSLGGSSNLRSMFYVATPQAANRLSLTGAANTAQVTQSASVKKDRLMLQDADFGIGGKARLKLRYQDVGENFAGGASLRDSKAAADDVLNQLEREKGIRRTGVDLSIPTGTNIGFNFSANQIKDKQDDILSSAFGYSGGNFQFDYSARGISKGFTRFVDLNEADAAQMAAEVGSKRTNYAMRIKTGENAGNSPIWSGYNEMRLQNEGGDLSYKTIDLDSGKIRVKADIRTMDPGFNAMTALNDSERTRMAQIARRQFNPHAQSSDVTAQDKALINNETGINRKNYIFEYNGWLSFGKGNAESSNGGSVDSTTFNVNLKKGNIDFYHHRIDKSFDKLAAMQPIELAHYGNEYGMSRTDVNGKYQLSFGEVAMTHGLVTDYQGASVTRQSVGFKNTRLQLQANFQNIDPRFSRTNDLSDGDKTMLSQELGFRRSDYHVGYDITKNLNIDSYFYDSTNVTADQARSQTRHKVTYSPQNGPKISAFSDDFSYISDTGVLSSYSHKRFTLDNKINVLGGILFKGMNDTNCNQENYGDPTKVTINQTHIESNQSAPLAFNFDTLNTDFGDNCRYEDNWELGAKTRVSRNLALTGAFSKTARQDNNSENNGRFGFEWSPKKDLTMGLKVANRDGGPNGSQQAKEFSMKGSVAKRILFLDNVTVDSGINTTDLSGKQVGCDNGLKLNAGLLGGNARFDNSDKLNPTTGIYYTSRIVQYESNKDPNKWYHLTFFRQNLITQAGLPARRRNYCLDMRMSTNTNLTMTNFFGKDGQNGAILPVGGGVFKITHKASANTSLFADYTSDANLETARHAKTTGFGFNGVLGNKANYEVYVGWSKLYENGVADDDKVYRFKYDHKMDDSHFISLSAQKKSIVDRSTINPFEGDTTARIDFRTVFN